MVHQWVRQLVHQVVHQLVHQVVTSVGTSVGMYDRVAVRIGNVMVGAEAKIGVCS